MKTGQLPAALVGGRVDTNNGAWLGSTAPTVGSKTSANSIPVVIASDQGVFTVTANVGTTNGLALDATLTGGTQKAITRGGAKGATAAADMTSTAQGADHQALDVQIYHGGVAKDPTAVRALTAADVVTAAQGTAAAVAGAWPVKHGDGVNSMPAGDAVARAIFHKVTDGTNAMAVKAASTAAAAADPSAVVALSPNRLATYGANYRLLASTVGQLSLTFTFATNTEKQLATIYHAATATKTVKIRKISIIVSTGAAGVFGFEVKQLSASSAPSGGNPIVTPGKHNGANAAAEATCLGLPTAAGSLVGTDANPTPHVEWNSAAAAATANPSGLAGQEIVLYDGRGLQDGAEPLTMRAGVAEGWAVVGRCTAAVALRFTVHILFTEE